MLNTAARRAAPSLASSVRNAGKQQMRFAHGEHFDTFGVNPVRLHYDLYGQFLLSSWKLEQQAANV